MVGIAQLVEHLIVVQGVAGSSPVTHPKYTGPEQNAPGFCVPTRTPTSSREGDYPLNQEVFSPV